MTDTATQISISDQIAEVAAEISMRDRVYPGLVRSGKYTPAEAARKVATMHQVLATLRWLARNSYWIHEVHELRREEAYWKKGGDMVHPAVRVVQEAFPGATVTAVRPISTKHAP